MMLIHTRTRPAPKISTPDYIGTGDFDNPTSSQSHRPRPISNRTGKLRVGVYPRVGSGGVESRPNPGDPTRGLNRKVP